MAVAQHLEQSAQRHPVEILHGNVIIIPFPAKVKDIDHIGVRERGLNMGLLDEHLLE